jgi:uncharacterized membrane protein YidH (DUF202 family)
LRGFGLRSHSSPPASQPHGSWLGRRSIGAWETVGVLLIMAGVVTAALARRRWRATDAAIREGEPLPAPGIAVMIAGVIVLSGLITTALLLGTNTGHVP